MSDHVDCGCTECLLRRALERVDKQRDALRAENAELLGALEKIQEVPFYRGYKRNKLTRCLFIARAAIEKATKSQKEADMRTPVEQDDCGTGSDPQSSATTNNGVRPVVYSFAELMEAKLRKHDADRGERGWKRDEAVDLFDRLVEEVNELRDAVYDDTSNEATISEAVDVANFAMMIVDVVNGFATATPPPSEEGSDE